MNHLYTMQLEVPWGDYGSTLFNGCLEKVAAADSDGQRRRTEWLWRRRGTWAPEVTNHGGCWVVGARAAAVMRERVAARWESVGAIEVLAGEWRHLWGDELALALPCPFSGEPEDLLAGAFGSVADTSAQVMTPIKVVPARPVDVPNEWPEVSWQLGQWEPGAGVYFLGRTHVIAVESSLIDALGHVLDKHVRWEQLRVG